MLLKAEFIQEGFRIPIMKHHTTKRSKGKHRNRARQSPANDISEDDIRLFVYKLEEKLESGGYPKVRELEKLLKPALSSPKIIAVLSYLQRSKMIEVDLDGNIIWIRRDPSAGSTIFNSAVMSEDFRKLIQNSTEMEYRTD